MYYVLIGREIRETSVDQWHAYRAGGERYKKSTQVKDVLIFTVFFGAGGIFFETVIIGGVLTGEIKHCTTLDEAEKQHADMVELVRKFEQ